MRLAVLGAGSWGTAFAALQGRAGAEVALWARRPEVCAAIAATRHNPDYLPDVELPPSVTATHDPYEAVAGADAVAVALPSQTVADNLAGWPDLLGDAPVLSLMKGLERRTHRRMSEVIAASGVATDRVAVLTGPNLSAEIAAGQPAASVVACVDHDTAVHLQHALATPTVRLYTVVDVLGCELAGAGKNVIALAVGIAAGLGYGDNTAASVITRGLAELTRLGRALGAEEHTFAGLAGMGDLVATCSSPLSRNRSFGEQLARGRSAADIDASTRQVAEGVATCSSMAELAAAAGVEMPITECVTEVVAGRLSPEQMAVSLLSRGPRPERDHH